MEEAEGGISSLRSAEADASSVLLPVVVAATASLLLGCGAGLRLGMMGRDKSPFSSRARTSISEISIKGMGGIKSGPEQLLGGGSNSPRDGARPMISRAI